MRLIAGLDNDSRVVMTLDAGGTSFRFCAIRNHVPATETVVLPSDGHDLNQCLENLINGFARVKAQCPVPPVAISFAFPGPADYPRGIIGDLVNLPSFRGGVALGPMLEDKFGIPTFINNDGDLFTYAEANFGFLPYVNDLLAKSGSPKRYQNLLGVTFGTGFGGGVVHDGKLFTGDNSSAGEVCALSNKLQAGISAEEGVSIRAVRRIYAQRAGIAFDDAPNPQVIEQIALGKADGNKEAAVEAYRSLGEIAGDALANALTMVDGLVVIGGGLSKGHQLFLPALMKELRSPYIGPMRDSIPRLSVKAFNLEDMEERGKFLAGETREIAVPGSQRKIKYDSQPRTAVGISRLGTSEAITRGAYAFALHQLDQK